MKRLSILLSLVLLSACAATSPVSSKLRVVATTTPVGALARVVGGDKIELATILQANMDAHEYEPRPDDVRAFANAQVILMNGVGLEKWLKKVIDNSRTSAQVTDTSRGIKLRKGDDVNSEGDPHIWHSAPNAIIMLDNIREALSAADAPNADFYRANAAAYTSKLNDLDAYIFAQIATLPPANRKLVSNHDTFGYYSERYGLVFVGSVVPGMDTNFQPSAQNLADLVQAIKTQKVKAIFTETSINPNLARRIAQEAGVKIVEGALYGDSLGPPGSGADTLDGMLKYNTDTIVANLK